MKYNNFTRCKKLNQNRVTVKTCTRMRCYSKLWLQRFKSDTVVFTSTTRSEVWGTGCTEITQTLVSAWICSISKFHGLRFCSVCASDAPDEEVRVKLTGRERDRLGTRRASVTNKGPSNNQTGSFSEVAVSEPAAEPALFSCCVSLSEPRSSFPHEDAA